LEDLHRQHAALKDMLEQQEKVIANSIVFLTLYGLVIAAVDFHLLVSFWLII